MKTKLLFLQLFFAAALLLSGCFRYAYKPAGTNDVVTVKKNAFSIIGKESAFTQEDSCEEKAPVLAYVKEHAKAVESSAKKNKSGAIEGFWVFELKSGVPEEGRYIAGIESERGAPVAKGWKQYDIAQQKYFMIQCDIDDSGHFYDRMVNGFIPNLGYELAGSVLEFYPASNIANTVYLYFPIKKKKD